LLFGFLVSDEVVGDSVVCWGGLVVGRLFVSVWLDIVERRLLCWLLIWLLL
jgi:hypothetical protein